MLTLTKVLPALISSGSFTGSFYGTSSYSKRALTASYALNASGGSGTSGTSGATGTSGTSGNSGTSGTSGNSGTNGTSGNSGSSGTSGGGASLNTGSTYPITSSWSRKAVTASYLNIISQSLIPAKNNTYSLGNPTNKWKDIYVSTASIYFDNYPLTVNVTNNIPRLNFFSSSIVTVPIGSNTNTASYALKALTASYVSGGGSGTSGTSGTSITASLQTGSIAKQTVLYNVVSGSQNVITGLNLSGNKWGVDIKEEWDYAVVPGDQYYNNVNLLLRLTGSNGSTTFVDNSSSPKTMTANGNAQISTAQTKFSGGSLYLDGNGDYLTTPNTTSLLLGTNDFTIECFLYLTQNGTTAVGETYAPLILLGNYFAENSNSRVFYSFIYNVQAGNKLSFSTKGGNSFGQPDYYGVSSNAINIPLNTWVHVAVTRTSNQIKFWYNGSLVGTDSSVSWNSINLNVTPGANNNLYIGRQSGFSSVDGALWHFPGYLSNIRITNGVARYTGNFTPATSQFPTNVGSTQYATKYIGLIGGLNDKNVDYGVQKLSDSSLKVVKMSQTTTPFPSGSLSSSVDRVYVNVLNYTNVSVTSSYATNALTASYILGGGANGSSGTSGATGSSGTSGNSGTSGSSGTSATAGSSGTSGVGSPGTSGTAGSSGTSITASLQTGSIAKQTILYNVVSGSQNVITGLNLSGNKWGVDIKEEWDAVVVPGDQYYNSCSILLHLNGSNGSTTFVDNGPNNLTVTGAGASISTVQSKFGGASAVFSGGNAITWPASNLFAYGLLPFTVEFWVYPNSVSSEYIYAQTRLGDNYFLIGIGGGVLYLTFGAGGGSSISGGSISTGTWTNIALVREGTGTNQTKLYINGTQVAAGTCNYNFSDTTFVPTLGRYTHTSANVYNGYVDEFRITKGIARYTSNFTPRTSEFQNNVGLTQYATKYVGLIGGLNDRSVDYGVQKLSDSSLKVVKMTQTTSPFPSGSLSSSVDRVYVNVLNYTNVSVTSSYATNALTASYILGGGANGSSGTSGATGATGTSGTSGNSGSSGTSGGGASLTTGSTYPITSSWSRRSLTASYALNASGGGSSLAVGQTFVSNGSQTVYTLSQTAANRDQILVVTNGVVQSRSGSNYTVSGTTLTLSDPVQSGGLIDVRFINAGQGSSGTSGANGTVQTGSIAKQTILYNVVSGSQNVITGLNLSGNKWGVDIKEEWDAVIVAGDQYYNSCSLLMHFNGSNGSTTFTDNSKNNFTVTSVNGTAISTDQSKFGGASVYFDGTNDYLSITNNSALNLSGGSYTIECWIRPTGNYSNYRPIIAKRIPGTGTSAWQVYLRVTTGYLSYFNGTEIVSSTTPTANVWSHVAAVYNGTTINLYLNGVSVLSTAVGNSDVDASINIGAFPSFGEYFIGYIDELRVTKGIARYTSNFTPPTSEFPNNASITQYATKYVGLIGGLNDKSVDYGVQKLSDSSLKVVKMSQTTSPFPSGSLSSSVDRVYVNVLDYNKVNVTSSYATNALTASYSLKSGNALRTGSLYPITASRAVSSSYLLGGSQILTEDKTVSFSSSFTTAQIQALIDVQPRNLGNKTLTFKFADGNYNLSTGLRFFNFSNGSIYISGNSSNNTVAFAKNVTLSGSVPIYISNNSTYTEVNYLRLAVNTSTYQTGLVIENGNANVYYCSFTNHPRSVTVGSGNGVMTQAGGTAWVRYCYFTSMDRYIVSLTKIVKLLLHQIMIIHYVHQMDFILI